MFNEASHVSIQNNIQVSQQENPHSIRPVGQLNTTRGLAKVFFLGIITLGIYPMVFYCNVTTDINIIAHRYDGRKTLHYLAMSMLALLTLGVIYFVWAHKLCDRIRNEQKRRLGHYTIAPSTFWLWNILGALILVGPFIYIYKLAHSMNSIAAHYNENG